ncbi:predicted protein [Aspergillus nidulans FGSC A4]|uniref:Uncharacterized protein n=1 Tax=Emericella nidulans (strain FGSC A4 / ATCC 38163 / CBS 112.46 / NRRL 194 / M139) TaxID=227321 RepID=Q5B2G9_EMENI|nr:hypothetical protein [Aspergillus nidulans FGSC A4]EAA62211.1 predicted protein [Aspergillus nidulans FGSC A4]CBF82222.1 TPA: hypothetical protein ANIA_05261 [Aspergillus nidulans FGSC A4]|eukprot:XP_662865.1 predicted protein [Aspergillus nidulans FGSC A4]
MYVLAQVICNLKIKQLVDAWRMTSVQERMTTLLWIRLTHCLSSPCALSCQGISNSTNWIGTPCYPVQVYGLEVAVVVGAERKATRRGRTVVVVYEIISVAHFQVEDSLWTDAHVQKSPGCGKEKLQLKPVHKINASNAMAF